MKAISKFHCFGFDGPPFHKINASRAGFFNPPVFRGENYRTPIPADPIQKLENKYIPRTFQGLGLKRPELVTSNIKKRISSDSSNSVTKKVRQYLPTIVQKSYRSSRSEEISSAVRRISAEGKTVSPRPVFKTKVKDC